jgi:hypothetical protein
MKTSKAKAALCAGVMASVLLGATLSFAETQWEKNHPRRDEVNDRLENQNERIKEGRENGTLNGKEARKLHREDRAIRRQERRYARRHGGHISKQEQHKLNREENRVSGQIYNEKHDGK